MINQQVKDYIQNLDKETLSKCLRARDIALDFERDIGATDTLLSDSASVYDVGMNYISSRIKNKQTSLSDVEKSIINLHSYIGYQVLRELGEREDICQMILFHHGLQPNAYGLVPKCMENVKKKRKQLFAIDAFIGLTSDRPYRRRFSNTKAYDIMCQSGTNDDEMMQFIYKHYIEDDRGCVS